MGQDGACPSKFTIAGDSEIRVNEKRDVEDDLRLPVLVAVATAAGVVQLCFYARRKLLCETPTLPVSECDKADYATHPRARLGNDSDTNNT